MGRVCLLYGEASVKYSFPAGHPFSSKRAEAFWSALKEEGLLEEGSLVLMEPVMVDEEAILQFHTEEYVRFVKKASELGYGYLDYGDTPTFKGIFEAASHVVGATLLGLDVVMKGEVDHAFNPVGGLHHARRDSAGGFCVFNDAAIAISYLLGKAGLKEVAYVDIDAHHGDGVLYSFYSDKRVIIADIHQDGRTLYPGTGFRYEEGEGEAKGTKLNIPLPPGAGDDEFVQAFQEVEDFLSKFNFELLLFQCGADGIEGDPLTNLEYSTRAHAYSSQKLVTMAEERCGGRIIAMGGGGYNLGNVARAWMEVVKAFLR